MKKIIVYVGKSEDGVYWGTSQNYEGVVSTFGATFEELKTNFEQAFFDNLAIAKETGGTYARKYKNICFDYKMDLSSFFNLFKGVSIQAIAEKSNLNPSLVRQYKNGVKTASEEQTQKIENAVHKLGWELLRVSF